MGVIGQGQPSYLVSTAARENTQLATQITWEDTYYFLLDCSRVLTVSDADTFLPCDQLEEDDKQLQSEPHLSLPSRDFWQRYFLVLIWTRAWTLLTIRVTLL